MSIVDLLQKDVADFTPEEADVLISGIESTETAPVPRVKATEIVGKVAAAHEAMVGKAFKALVAVLAGTDDTQRLLLAAITSLVDLAKGATEQRFALVREGSDVLLQVALRSSGFTKEVQQAASAAFRSMLAVDFKGCIMKLLHWLSDEREEETDEQLLAERTFAMTLLGRLVRGKEHAEQWTEETQRECLQFAQIVLGCSTAAQFSSLVSILAHLPIVAEGKCAPLLDTVAALPLETVRGLESVSGLAPYVPKDATNDAVLEKLAPALANAEDSALGVALSKAVSFATTLTSAEAAAAQLPAVAAAVSADTQSVWTKTEALLAAFANLGRKAPDAFLPLLGAEEMQAKMQAINAAAKAAKPKALFAVKKVVDSGAATKQHGAALSCLSSVIALTEALGSKKLPEAAKPSWECKPNLPAKTQPKAAASVASSGKSRQQGQGRKRGATGNGNAKSKGRKH